MPRGVKSEDLGRWAKPLKYCSTMTPSLSSQNSTDKPRSVPKEKLEELGSLATPIVWTQCHRWKEDFNQSHSQGHRTCKSTQRASKDDRHDSRASESSSYGDGMSTTSRRARSRRSERVHQGDGMSTTSRRARSRRSERVHQGDGRGGYDQGEDMQAATAPPPPHVPAAAATPAPSAPASPPSHPTTPDHTQNDAAQTPAADVDAAQGDAAHADGADAHASQTGDSPVNSEKAAAGPSHQGYTELICAQGDARISDQLALVPWVGRHGTDPFDRPSRRSSALTASSSSTLLER